jgi:multiple sugar transport system ATP-binding protein
VVVALDAESRVREDDRAHLWFDPARLLVFDPETGANLTRDEDAAREIDERNEKVRRASLERAQRREQAAGSASSTAREPERAAS